VVETVRHLTPQEFQAYAGGQLTGTRLEHCQSHLDSCEDCRAELEELRTFKDDFATFPRPEPNRGVLRKQRLGITLPWAAAMVIVLVATVSTVLWWKHDSQPRTKAPVAGAPEQAPAAVAQTAAELTQAPPAVAHVPAAGTHATTAATPARAAVAHTSVAAASAAVGKPAATPPASAPETRVFALLAPLGPTISDLRPEFTWQELPGALHYSVVIVDARLRPVQHSSALRDTSWRPKHPLHHGRTYMWQVTATIHGGHKVVASAPATITEAK
jgi:hypothetical protein